MTLYVSFLTPKKNQLHTSSIPIPVLQSISLTFVPSSSCAPMLCEQGHPLCVIVLPQRSMENNKISCCLLLSTCFRQLNRNLCLEKLPHGEKRSWLGFAFCLFYNLSSLEIFSFLFLWFYENNKNKQQRHGKTFAPSFLAKKKLSFIVIYLCVYFVVCSVRQ